MLKGASLEILAWQEGEGCRSIAGIVWVCGSGYGREVQLPESEVALIVPGSISQGSLCWIKKCLKKCSCSNTFISVLGFF